MSIRIKRASRRNPEQWAQVIEQKKDSGLSARKFCTEQNIGYASFCQWHKRLAQADSKSEPSPFIDLSQLNTTSNSGHWNIVLRLGNGVELALSQI